MPDAKKKEVWLYTIVFTELGVQAAHLLAHQPFMADV